MSAELELSARRRRLLTRWLKRLIKREVREGRDGRATNTARRGGIPRNSRFCCNYENFTRRRQINCNPSVVVYAPAAYASIVANAEDIAEPIATIGLGKLTCELALGVEFSARLGPI